MVSSNSNTIMFKFVRVTDLIQAMTLDRIEDDDALLPITPTESTSARPP